MCLCVCVCVFVCHCARAFVCVCVCLSLCLCRVSILNSSGDWHSAALIRTHKHTPLTTHTTHTICSTARTRRWVRATRMAKRTKSTSAPTGTLSLCIFFLFVWCKNRYIENIPTYGYYLPVILVSLYAHIQHQLVLFLPLSFAFSLYILSNRCIENIRIYGAYWYSFSLSIHT